MDGMNSTAMDGTNATAMVHPHKMMMHMTFFWGKNAEILFSGWPGTSSGMYALALIFVFFLSLIVEWLSHSNLYLVKEDGSNRVAAGLIQTLIHAIRVGLAYMVMLAVMSFNGGVFVMAVVGHAIGFFLFGSRALKKAAPEAYGKTSDLSTMNC